MFPLLMLSRAPPGEGLTPALPCSGDRTPGFLGGTCGAARASALRGPDQELRAGPASPLSCQHQRLLDPEVPSASSGSPAAVLRLHEAAGRERRGLFASGWGLLLFAIVLSDLPERSGTEVWGRRLGGRAQRAEPLAGPSVLSVVLQSLGEASLGFEEKKGPTPFPRCRMARGELQTRPQAAAGRAGSAEASIPRLAGMRGGLLGTASAAPARNPGRAASPAPAALGKGWQRRRGWHSCVAFRDT